MKRACTRRDALLVGVVLLVLFGLLAGEAAAQVTVVSPLAQHFDVVPGESYAGFIRLANRGGEPAAVAIYQTDYRFDAEGRSYYEAPGTLPRSNAPWIAVGRSQVTVPPGKEVEVLYRIAVPSEEEMSGTYWSMIMVEPLLPGDPEAPVAEGEAEPGQVALGVRQRLRYGVQVVTETGGSAEARLEFTNPSLLYREDDRGYTFQVDLENSGERLLVPRVWLELYDLRGEQIDRVEAESRRIYPGTTVRIRIDLGSLADRRYQALLVADNLDAVVFAARYTIELEAP